MSAQDVLGLDESNDTEVQEPSLQETANALEKRQGVRSIALTGLLLLACFYTLYLAEGFFAPLVLAIVFNFFLSPFVRVLSKLRIPDAAGAGIVMLACLSAMGFLIYEFSGPVTDWVERAPRIMSNYFRGVPKAQEAGGQGDAGHRASQQDGPGGERRIQARSRRKWS